MKRSLQCFLASTVVPLALLSGEVFAAKAASKSRDYTVGKPTQNVKPREMREVVRPDGKRSIVTGQKRDASGKIVGAHSHSVTQDGKVVYSRTAGGKVVADDKAKSKK